MIKSGPYIIIPMGVSSFVLEEVEGGLKHVGEALDKTLEELFNDMRQVVAGLVERERELKKRSTNNWKRFQATKEFMGEEELELTESIWGDFDLEKLCAECDKLAAGYEQTLFELTDLMLEHNLTIKAMDGSNSELKGVSLESIKGMLGNLGKSE